jgi:hypothetical protein
MIMPNKIVIRKNKNNTTFTNVIVCAITDRGLLTTGKLWIIIIIKIFSTQSLKHKKMPSNKSVFCHCKFIFFLNKQIENEAKNKLYINGKIKSIIIEHFT